jgi:hypothetical protein
MRREGKALRRQTTCDVWATQTMVPRFQIVNARQYFFHDARGTESTGPLVLYLVKPSSLNGSHEEAKSHRPSRSVAIGG